MGNFSKGGQPSVHLTKGKFCIIVGRPANKGLGMLQMSGAKWRTWKSATVESRPVTGPLPFHIRVINGSVFVLET